MPDRGSLYHLLPAEVLPPPHLWEHIAENLPVGSEAGLLHSVQAAEVPPPPNVWSNIADRLEPVNIIPSLSISSNHQRIWKTMGVAAGVAALSLLVLLYVNRETSTKITGSINQIVDSSIKNQAGKIIARTPGYITVYGWDGKPVNISAKLTAMAESLYGGKSSADENEKWKQRLQEWAGHVNEVVAEPIPVNFADPVDLMMFLETKK